MQAEVRMLRDQSRHIPSHKAVDGARTGGVG